MPVANREAGERLIQLGDEKFVVKFSTTTLIRLENSLDLETGTIQQKLANFWLGGIREVIFHGVQKYHSRDIRNAAQLDDLIDEIEDFQEVMTPLMEAFEAGVPGLQSLRPDDEEPEPEASENGTKKSRSKAKLEEVSAEA